MNFFDKLFMDGDWCIAIRKNQWQWPFNYDEPFHKFYGSEGYWYADPMIVTHEGNYYLFCEAFNKKKKLGEIAVSVYDGKQWGKPRVIISNNYHMSYPCVFKTDDGYYMIPESQEVNRLELYKSDDFPYKWNRIKVLLENTRMADPTVWEHDGIFYMAGYTRELLYKLEIYQYDTKKIELKYLTTIEYDKNIGRPAGFFIKQNDNYIRPTQDCSLLYGRTLLWHELRFNNDTILEELIGTMDNTKIIVDNYNGVDRIHTFTRAGGFEVIDYCVNHFDLFKRFKIIWRQYLKKNRDNKKK